MWVSRGHPLLPRDQAEQRNTSIDVCSVCSGTGRNMCRSCSVCSVSLAGGHSDIRHSTQRGVQRRAGPVLHAGMRSSLLPVIPRCLRRRRRNATLPRGQHHRRPAPVSFSACRKLSRPAFSDGDSGRAARAFGAPVSRKARLVMVAPVSVVQAISTMSKPIGGGGGPSFIMVFVTVIAMPSFSTRYSASTAPVRAKDLRDRVVLPWPVW